MHCLQEKQAQTAAMHGCHIAALKTQLHAAVDQASSPSAASPTVGRQSADTGAEGYQKTIAELRAVVEGKAREASSAAARIRALEQDKAKAERWASTSYGRLRASEFAELPCNTAQCAAPV